MHRLRKAAIVGILAGSLARASAPPTPDTGVEKPVPTVLVGQIHIIGNTATPPRAILDHLGFAPGFPATAADLRRAERRLAKLGIFRVDRHRGIQPTVTFFIDLEGTDVAKEVKDVIVIVEERPGNDLVYRFERLVADGLRWLAEFQR